MAFAKVRPVPIECANNVALYYRYSSDKQTENSIDGQRRACLEFCKNKGYNVVAEYIDRAISGTSDERPEFQRMIEDSVKQQFAFIVVYRFDRFARNRFDSAIYKKKLESVGVRVLSTAEQVGDGDEAIILEAIYEAMDEEYSRRLSRIVKRGMREIALKGLWTGGVIPYGYKIEEQRLVVDERTAPAVRLIFEMYASGKTKTQIADALNARGFRTPKGNPYTCKSFEKILRNTLYYGEYDFEDIKRSCPPIISKELFDTAQALFSKNKRSCGKKVSDTFFALGGKIFCGNCGAAMIGDSGTSASGKKTYYYYTCGNKKRTHSCKKKNERKDFIEWYVCEQTVKFILSPNNIKKIASRVEEAAKKALNSGELDALEKRSAAINRELDNLVDTLIKTDSPAAICRINEKIAALEQQQKSIELNISKLQLRKSQRITAKEVESFLRGFCKGDLFDEDFRIKIINTLVNCVYIFDDRVVIYYNIRNSKQVSYINMLSDIDFMDKSEEKCSDSVSSASPKKKHFKRSAFFFFLRRWHCEVRLKNLSFFRAGLDQQLQLLRYPKM